MKKFMISMFVSIVLITAGGITLFFELRQYDFFDETKYTPYTESAMKTFAINTMDGPIIIDSDASLNIEWRYDESMKHTVNIMTSPYLFVNYHDNYMKIDHHYTLQDAFKMGKYILDGLKKREIRFHDFDHHEKNELIIICSKKSVPNILIHD